jgi:hypothetical protein
LIDGREDTSGRVGVGGSKAYRTIQESEEREEEPYYNDRGKNDTMFSRQEEL